jgi:hypothetical protein
MDCWGAEAGVSQTLSVSAMLAGSMRQYVDEEQSIARRFTGMRGDGRG